MYAIDGRLGRFEVRRIQANILGLHLNDSWDFTGTVGSEKDEEDVVDYRQEDHQIPVFDNFKTLQFAAIW